MPEFRILKTSETDIDSTDIWRFAFHSNYPTFKIATSGNHSLTVAKNSDYGYYDVTHSLGYYPVYFAFIKYGTKVYQVPAGWVTDIEVSNDEGGTSILLFGAYMSDTNTLKFEVFTADGAGVASAKSFTVYWLIMLDEF